MQRPQDELCLFDILDEHARSRPHEWAAVEDATRIDYSQAADRVRRLTTLLLEYGVSAGDRVAWVGQNSFRVMELMFAAARLGAMVCPVNWRQTFEELDFVLRDLDAKVVVTQPGDLDDRVEALRGAVHGGTWVIVDDSDTGYEASLNRCEADDLDRPGDPAAPVLVMYTAAHEGTPNGAMMTHRGLVAAGVVHAAMNGIFDRRPVFLAGLPLYHVATFMGCLSTFLLGGTSVYLARPAPADICRLVDFEGCTWAYLTGPLLGQVAEEAEHLGTDLRTLLTPDAYLVADPRWSRLGTRSSAPWSRHPGAFGQTEMTGIITYTALAVGATGAAGRPSPWCQVRIIDEHGDEVPTGETGEITARGATAGAGYWNRSDVNVRRSRNGWWHTGDLGRRESDGSLTFVGPKTRMVKSGKENIYPAEVERCLREHPDIADVAVIGIPDDEWEQSVLAVVVPAAGSQLSSEQVILHCRERIASYKKPRFVTFADALPRIGGQLDREELDKRYGGGGYPGVGS